MDSVVKWIILDASNESNYVTKIRHTTSELPINCITDKGHFISVCTAEKVSIYLLKLPTETFTKLYFPDYINTR